MKMKRTVLSLLIVVIGLVAGCTPVSDALTEEEAKALVIEEHSGDTGSVEIMSVDIEDNAYIVEWKNEENLEGGTDKVTSDGTVEMIEAYIE